MAIENLKLKVKPVSNMLAMAKKIEIGEAIPDPALAIPRFSLKVELEGSHEDVQAIAAFIRKQGNTSTKPENSAE